MREEIQAFLDGAVLALAEAEREAAAQIGKRGAAAHEAVRELRRARWREVRRAAAGGLTREDVDASIPVSALRELRARLLVEGGRRPGVRPRASVDAGAVSCDHPPCDGSEGAP